MALLIIYARIRNGYTESGCPRTLATFRSLLPGRHQNVLGYIAAALFIIAFLINATTTSTPAVFSPTSLLLAGLACLALHLAGVGTRWSLPTRRARR